MLRGSYNFRGFEEKTSSKGNRYLNMFLEDNDNGKAVTVYVSDSVSKMCSPSINNIERGTDIGIIMDYHVGFNGNMTSDFVGFYEV